MAEHTVPMMASDTLPVHSLPELLAHLDALHENPNTPINSRLLDLVELQLTDANSAPLLPTLLPRLTTLLFNITGQDPSPLLSLTTRLLRPIPFQDILPFASPEALSTALKSQFPAANILALSILHKAALSLGDLDFIVDRTPQLVGDMITLWIGSREVGSAEKAATVIGDLLEMDCELVVPSATKIVNGDHGRTINHENANGWSRHRLETRGQGRLWRLIFDNLENLNRIVSNCTLRLPQEVLDALPEGATARFERDVTISQGRLLRLLPRLAALNIQPLLIDHRDLYRPFRSPAPSALSVNLFFWAGLEMVDPSDMLMRLTHVDFFEALVSVMRASTHQETRIKDDAVKSLLREAMARDETGELRQAMTTLPNRTVEAESDAVRRYLADVL